MRMYPTLLTIAGSDSSAGAGIQADLKTIAANGCYGASVITAITAQNTQGVREILDIPPSMIKSQFMAIMEDLEVKAVKIGMLHSAESIMIVANLLKDCTAPIIIDPVMSAKDATSLLEDKALVCLKNTLFKQAFLITPNIPEAEILTGMKIENLEDMKAACLKMDAENILLKGGHLEGDMLVDLLYCDSVFYTFEHPKLEVKNSHGTGCTLSSAIASFVAQEEDLPTACQKAIAYVQQTLLQSYDTGKGCGALNHFFMLEESVNG